MGIGGVARKVGIVIVCVALLVSFILMNSFYVLSSSLKFENIQPQIKPILKEVIYGSINPEEVESSFQLMRLYCGVGNSEYNVTSGDYSLSISCEDILTKDSNTLIDFYMDKFIADNYYKEYQCSFWQCFQQEQAPYFLVSEMSSDYFNSKFYISLIVSAILIVLLFFLVQFKRNTLILTGSLLAVSSLPFAKLNAFASLIPEENIVRILEVIFTQAYKAFLITFILGIVLLAIGIGLKIWSSRQVLSSSIKR